MVPARRLIRRVGTPIRRWRPTRLMPRLAASRASGVLPRRCPLPGLRNVTEHGDQRVLRFHPPLAVDRVEVVSDGALREPHLLSDQRHSIALEQKAHDFLFPSRKGASLTTGGDWA